MWTRSRIQLCNKTKKSRYIQRCRIAYHPKCSASPFICLKFADRCWRCTLHRGWQIWHHHIVSYISSAFSFIKNRWTGRHSNSYRLPSGRRRQPRAGGDGGGRLKVKPGPPEPRGTVIHIVQSLQGLFITQCQNSSKGADRWACSLVWV